MHVLDAAITATDVVSGCRLVKSPHYDHSLSLYLCISLSLALDRLHESISRSPVYRPCAEVSAGARGSYELGFLANHGDPSRRGHSSPPRGWLLSWQKPPVEYCGISWKCIVLLLIRAVARAPFALLTAFQMPGVKAILR